jgi:hypothetical protein
LQYHFNWKTISIAAGMTIRNFCFRIFDKAVGKEETIIFLADLLQYLRQPLLVVWDRLPDAIMFTCFLRNRQISGGDNGDQ